MIDEPCQKTDKRENCILVGRTAQFCIENEFAKPITKDNALKILRESEEEGLVHKMQ
ncbi:MAG: hypothetical protein GF311_15405 [Candidatus Lokiarchaeota archaeon]|nr:hypothetical protein [Candidatus Lokiarchaeota archaeon]